MSSPRATAARSKARTTPGSPRSERGDIAARHRKARNDHSHELAEDYVEVISHLIGEHGEARLVDIAERLGVTHVTVTRTLTRLQKLGLVQRQRYRAIFLTRAGEKLASRVSHRHTIVLEFLLSLGVARATAENDAEGIEHHVSEATLRAFERHVGKVSMKKTRRER